MKKSGQVSVFVIIGIIVIVVFALVFFFRDKITQTIRNEPTNTEEYLNQQLNDIKNEIGKCVLKETSEASKLLMSNGGYFGDYPSYIHYYGFSYPVLCKEINNTGTCLSQPILVLELQKRLNNYLPGKINNCINFEQFKNKDYTLTNDKINLTTQILDENILVNLNLPIILKKDFNIAESNLLLYDLKIPLGELTRVVNDLVQEKADGKEIDTISYQILSFNKYKVEVRKPYPDEVYNVSLNGNLNYNFYFGIEGVGRYPRPEGRI